MFFGDNSDNEKKQSDVTVQYNMTVSMATDDNVWDDFDDCGGGVDGFDGLVPYVTPAKSQSQVRDNCSYYCEIIINHGILIFADFVVNLNHKNKNPTKYNFHIYYCLLSLKP